MADLEYIIMMEDSLDKKVRILQQLQLRNYEQREILNNPNSDPDELENNMEAKDILIEQLLQLDQGFEILFNRVKDVLERNKETYAPRIEHMKKMIVQITDLSASVQADEYKNRELAKARFASVKKDVRDVKKSQAAVSMYYQNMLSSNGAVEPQFLDRKH